MKTWRLPDAGDLPAELRDGCEQIIARLRELGPGRLPRLAEVITHSHSPETEYVFEVADGEFMQIFHDAEFDADAMFWMDAADCAARTAVAWNDVAAFVTSLRWEVDARVVEARAAGLPVQAHRMDTLAIDDWTSPHQPLVLVGLEVLGDNLKPANLWFPTSSIADLRQRFGEAMQSLHTRQTVADRLGNLGASGTIDGVALRALLRSAASERAIRKLAEVDRMELDDGTMLVWTDGHVSSLGGEDGGDLEWAGNVVTLNNLEVPSTVCALAVGRAFSDFVQHPAFDEGAVVRHVSIEGKRYRGTEVTLDIDQWYIDTVEGRYWRQ